MTVTAQPPERSLESLQILRAVAAVVVSFYHAYLIIAQPEYIGEEVFGPLMSRGWLGVNLFFALSGFIILFAHRGDLGNRRALPLYAAKRFIRIYPVYWVFLTLFIMAAAAGIGHPDFEWSAPNLVSSYLLLKIADPLSLPLRVAWTLFYEVTFYAMFALFLVHARLAVMVFAIWAAAILVAVLGYDHREMGLLNAWNLYFPAGMLACLCYGRLPARWGVPMALGGVLMLVAIASTYLGERATFVSNDPMVALAYIVPCALIITGAALAERHYRWSAPRPLLLLGEASYSVYLVHSAIISLLAIFYIRLDLGFVPAELYFVFVAVSSIIGGVLAHRIVEVPLLRKARHLLLKRRTDVAATITPVTPQVPAQEKT